MSCRITTNTMNKRQGKCRLRVCIVNELGDPFLDGHAYNSKLIQRMIRGPGRPSRRRPAPPYNLLTAQSQIPMILALSPFATEQAASSKV